MTRSIFFNFGSGLVCGCYHCLEGNSFVSMKLATYKDGSRDGQLVVVSRDLRTAHYATGIASRMQQVLDDWGFIAPQLQDLYHLLNTGRAPHIFHFDSEQCMAPLPRAQQWLEGNAYPSHWALTQPECQISASEPFLRQGAGDSLVGACAEVVVPSVAMGVDFGAGIAALTTDISLGSTPEQALNGIRLLMLSNTICLRNLMKVSSLYAYGNVQSWPAVGLSPVAVTVDELGDAWRLGRMHLPVHSSCNGRKVGMCDAGEDMAFHFGRLLSHAAKTRPLHAGSMMSTGVVSNLGVRKQKEQTTEWPKGFHSIAEKRAVEVQQSGQVQTPYLQFGDVVRIEVKDKSGQSIFGAIDQTIVSPSGEGDS